MKIKFIFEWEPSADQSKDWSEEYDIRLATLEEIQRQWEQADSCDDVPGQINYQEIFSGHSD